MVKWFGDDYRINRCVTSKVVLRRRGESLDESIAYTEGSFYIVRFSIGTSEDDKCFADGR